MIQNTHSKNPQIERALFIAESAVITGDVTIKEKSSVWHNAVIRGDIAPIRIGKGTNIQDNCVLHISTDIPLNIGDYITVGHTVILHSCTIKDFCIIGMGAIILDDAVIGENSIVGAGALVTKGKIFPSRSLILGSPAKLIRKLSDEEVQGIKDNAERYIQHSAEMIQ